MQNVEFHKSLSQKMYRFKYDKMEQNELNEFYNDISNLIWKIIHTTYSTINKMDLHQDIWLHITQIKHKWDENAKNHVSTWLYIVIKNQIRKINKYNMKNMNIIFDGLLNDETFDMKYLNDGQVEFMDGFNENYTDKLFGIVDELDDVEKQYIDIMMHQDNELIRRLGKNKKKNMKRLSHLDIGKILGMSRGKSNFFKEKLKRKILKRMEKIDVF